MAFIRRLIAAFAVAAVGQQPGGQADARQRPAQVVRHPGQHDGALAVLLTQAGAELAQAVSELGDFKRRVLR